MKFNIKEYNKLVEKARIFKAGNVSTYEYIIANKEKQPKLHLSFMQCRIAEIARIFKLVRDLEMYINFEGESPINLEVFNDAWDSCVQSMSSAAIALGAKDYRKEDEENSFK